MTGAKRRVSVRIDRMPFRSAAADKDQGRGAKYLAPVKTGLKVERVRSSNSRARGNAIHTMKANHRVAAPPLTPLSFSTTHRLPILTDLSNGNSKKFFDEQEKMTKQVVNQHRQTMMKSQLHTISQYSSLQQNLKTIQEKQYTRIRHISNKHKKKTEKVEKIIEQELQDKVRRATKNRQREENHLQ